jgi:NADPH:quinone reductase-like Zn-dependent oxidoreductase
MPEKKNNVGAWSNYTNVHKLSLFVIDEDVPVQSAASGIINPLTVIGIFSIIKKLGLNGIVQTAASSALGKMVNKLCMK